MAKKRYDKKIVDEHDSQESSHRDLFKRVGVGTVALAGGALIKRELDIGENGLETPDAIFFPIYERHDRDFAEDAIPHNIDYYFHEPLTQLNITGVDPEWQAKTSVRNWTNEQLGLLNRFSQEGTNVVMGDIDISFQDRPDEFILLQGTPIFIDSIAAGLTLYLGVDRVKKYIHRQTTTTYY